MLNLTSISTMKLKSDELFYQAKLRQVLRNLPRKIAIVAVNFSKERFKQQAWLDGGLQKWQPRKNSRDSKRALLVKSGRLRRSIRAVSVTDKQIRIGTDVPYAQVHNEGGNGTITQNVRSHSRREHSRKACYRNGRKVSACRVKQHTVRPYSRQVQVNIPKRQFMGPSKALNKRVERIITRELNSVLE